MPRNTLFLLRFSYFSSDGCKTLVNFQSSEMLILMIFVSVLVAVLEEWIFRSPYSARVEVAAPVPVLPKPLCHVAPSSLACGQHNPESFILNCWLLLLVFECF